MLNLRQSQSLQQKLSPQQIQYIKLLQLPTLALEQRIKAELESNPLLEEGADEFEDDTPEGEIAAAEAAQVEEEPAKNDDEFDWDEFINAPDDLYGYKAQTDYDGGLAELAEWVARQQVEDRVAEARKELERRGLVA